jgi:hypothetical protein
MVNISNAQGGVNIFLIFFERYSDRRKTGKTPILMGFGMIVTGTIQ